MPSSLRNILSLEVLVGLLVAALAPALQGEGAWLPSALAALLPVALCLAFWLRLPVSYPILTVYCGLAALGGLAYLALHLLVWHDWAIGMSGALLTVESVVCAGLFFELRRQASRDWFRGGWLRE